jgi:nicotinamide phosphoribosyltransferase
MYINPLTAIDFYKTDHRRQYPVGTSEVYSNFTPRSGRLANVLKEQYDNKVVFFGLQYFLKEFLIKTWNENFFKQDKNKVVLSYKRRMDMALGIDAIETHHIAALHDLGYLPLKIKALPEGIRSPIGIPLLTIVNTHEDFFWLTNYIETALLCYLWRPITSATIAYEYKRLLVKHAIKTGTDLDFVEFQAHDFSFRGMSGIETAMLNGAAHLTSFIGTDCVSAIDFVEEFYLANVEKEVIGCSVPATEHSVMCMDMEENELETFRRLITKIYPSGIVSIVSDTWDFWRVITKYTVTLKDEILKRDGKLVIRPDSGDPVKIVVGDPEAPLGTPEYKGAIECLWEIFGGTITDKGYKLLDPHIGLIYGDSITLARAEQILLGLEKKGFASGNIVFGIGSYTYQYATRDSFGLAVKATSGVVNGKRRNIFKDPKTDSGLKRSAKGLLRVEQEGDSLVLYDNQTEEQEEQGILQCVFLNGELTKEFSLQDIRSRLRDIGHG